MLPVRASACGSAVEAPVTAKMIACLISMGPISGLAATAQAQEFVYRTMCDASAAVSLDADHFVVANDERNTLRIYKRDQPDPVTSVDLFNFLGTSETKESDLEGAARIGNRIYWISSHGRNSDAEFQERRHRFFATDISSEAGVPTVKPVGDAPYKKLLEDLVAAPELLKYGLATASEKAPEAERGLNIEGLAATPDGKLLIGFRNPIPGKKALIVPLEKPDEVIEGGKARFGIPDEIDLAERGIRSIERVGDDYLIVAGPTADKGSFSLYRWAGPQSDKLEEIKGVDFGALRPEALFAIPHSNKIQVLSDDGDEPVGSQDCKKVKDASKQSFRSKIFSP